MQESLTGNIFDYVITGNSKFIEEAVDIALAEGISPGAILYEGLISAMDFIGNRFSKREIFLPDVLLSAKAMKLGIAKLKPLLSRERIYNSEKIVIGTVQGDLHDIGKNLVGIMLEGAGYRVIDLGNDVHPEKFIDTAISENAVIIGMSALLTTTMPVMKKVIEILSKSNRDGIKVIVGGAPVTEEYAFRIGADAYCYDASNAVATVKKLLSSE